MKNLRSSVFLRVFCFILSLIFCWICLLNVSLAIFAYKNDIIFDDKNSIERKVYSYLANDTSSEINSYFNCVKNEIEDNNNKDLSDNAETYRSRFSEQNCNIGFVIKNEAGEVLLKNFEVPNPKFSFNIHLQRTENNQNENSTDVSDEGMTTMYYEPDKNNAAEENMTEASTETTSEASTVVTPDNTQAEEITDIITDADSSTVVSNNDPELSNGNTYTYRRVYSENNITYNFLYMYTNEINQTICDYCYSYYLDMMTELKDVADENDNTVNLVFYQNEYTVLSDGSVVRDNSNINNNISSQNNTVKNYTLSVFIPNNMNSEIKDIYFYASKAINILFAYSKVIIPVTIISMILAVVLFIWVLYSAGYKCKNDLPYAGGLHKLPFDLITAAVLGAFLFAFAISDIELEFLIVIAGLIPFVLFIFETLAVRIRSHCFIKRNVIYYICVLIKKLYLVVKRGLKSASEHMDFLWKAGIAYFLLSIIEGIGLVLIVNIGENAGYGLVLLLFVLAKIFLLLPLAVIIAVNLSTLQKGTKRLSQGDIVNVNGPLLFGEFKKNAQYLNSISNGVDKAVNERVKSESMKTELITNVSHDLKTPLTSIVNYIDLLKKLNVSDEKAIEYIDVLDRQSQRLKKLTIDIVDASKAATGNIEVNNESIALNVLLQQVNGEYSEKLKEKMLTPVEEFAEEDIKITADGRLLWRVLDNLMNNICKYSMAGTRVYISLKKENGKAKILFRNISGSELNISPEELTERFVRGDRSRNTEGSGLGLSIAKSLTELMNGTFSISIDGDLFKVQLEFDCNMQ